MKRVAAAVLVLALCVPLFAQTAANGPSKLPEAAGAARVPSVKDDPASSARSNQPLNVEYTESILKNTTDPMFLTELVDHLPASATVPSPEKILGYPVGTPNKLTYTKDQYRYYRELEKASSRVKTFAAPEKSRC